MSDAAAFLIGFARALSAMVLYHQQHPARERALEVAYESLQQLQSRDPQLRYTFFKEEVVFGNQPLAELKAWDYAPKLVEAGIERLECDDCVSREDFEAFLEIALGRLNLLALPSSQVRQERKLGIRFGELGVRGGAKGKEAEKDAYTLAEEADTVRWIHEEVQRGNLPLAEADAVVRSLAVAMHSEREIVLPLLQLRQFDEYTTTHSLNVSVLAMGLAEFLGMQPQDVRAFGTAGLLHDIGKVRIPKEVLTKPGQLSAAEREVMNRHPADGARVIFESTQQLELAAVVAYEHHIMLDGRGYPLLMFRRDCHDASRLVHVCDLYDALRTNRPYREGWPSTKVLEYISTHAGSELDPEYASAFVKMMAQWDGRLAVLQDENERIRAGNGAAAQAAGAVAGGMAAPSPAASAPQPTPPADAPAAPPAAERAVGPAPHSPPAPPGSPS
ncbi:MAG: HD domain-containing protein [Gemmatimonadetes bacterium]|nr:HD domain-containing protein [Gemmatimonadota bacterium]